MWPFNIRSEDRRNSASVVELRRAAKLAQSRLTDSDDKTSSLRRANSCKERDGEESRLPSYYKPPYPDYYYDSGDYSDSRRGTPESDSDVKLHQSGHRHSSRDSPVIRSSGYSKHDFSSLDYIPGGKRKHDKHSRSVKDLRNCEGCTSTDDSSLEYDRRGRNNGYSSPRHSSLTGIPENTKADKTCRSETSSLCGSLETFSLGSYYSFDYFFKVMLLGDSGVGKTCLVTKFRDGVFLSGNFIATVGFDYKNKTISVDGSLVRLQVWDSAGQERFRSLTTSCYRDAQALFILYDIQSRDSFNNSRMWLQEARHVVKPDVAIFLVGNKSDVPDSCRAVSRQEGAALARQLRLTFIETSAKSGRNVQLAFQAVVRQLMSQQSTDPKEQTFDVQEFISSRESVCYSLCSMCRIC